MPRKKQQKSESFAEQYLASLDKKLIKKEKERLAKTFYRFSYVDKEEGICINTILKNKKPIFIIWDGKEYLETDHYETPEGLILSVPPINDPFYRMIYKKVIIPDQIITDDVKTEDVDGVITKILKDWFVQPDDYFIIARAYIKFTWVYERFDKRPYLNIFGDWGTGKSEWGKYIGSMCQYGLMIDSPTYAALSRILDLTNCSAILDEMDTIDKKEYAKIREILINGYDEDGNFVVAEAESKKFTPKVFRVDQPKIIIKRGTIKDGALASRIIPFKMLPRDIPEEMRRSDEYSFQKERKRQMTYIANLLLKWRWGNIFEEENNIIIPDMLPRFNDVISPLLKVSKEEDRKVLMRHMKNIAKAVVTDISEEIRIEVLKLLVPIYNKYTGLTGLGAKRIPVKEVVDLGKEKFENEMSEIDLKRVFNTKTIKRTLIDWGFEIESYRNKPHIRMESFVGLLEKLSAKYDISLKEEDEEENSVI